MGKSCMLCWFWRNCLWHNLCWSFKSLLWFAHYKHFARCVWWFSWVPGPFKCCGEYCRLHSTVYENTDVTYICASKHQNASFHLIYCFVCATAVTLSATPLVVAAAKSGSEPSVDQMWKRSVNGGELEDRLNCLLSVSFSFCRSHFGPINLHKSVK